MKLIIDRIEDEFAVCENEEKKIVNIHISKLPINAKPGDILCIEKDNITINKRTTEERKRFIEQLTKDIWQ